MVLNTFKCKYLTPLHFLKVKNNDTINDIENTAHCDKLQQNFIDWTLGGLVK